MFTSYEIIFKDEKYIVCGGVIYKEDLNLDLKTTFNNNFGGCPSSYLWFNKSIIYSYKDQLKVRTKINFDAYTKLGFGTGFRYQGDKIENHPLEIATKLPVFKCVYYMEFEMGRGNIQNTNVIFEHLHKFDPATCLIIKHGIGLVKLDIQELNE